MDTPLAERLREERERLGLTQMAMAEVGGVSRKTQSSYEAAQSAPDTSYLLRAHAAGMDVVYVLTGRHQSEAPGSSEPSRPPDEQLWVKVMEATEQALDERGAKLSAGRRVKLWQALYGFYRLSGDVDLKTLGPLVEVALGAER